MSTINTIDFAYQETGINEEKVELTQDAIYKNMEEQDFRRSVTDQISRARGYWQKFLYDKRQQTNLKYWIGNQVDGAALRDDEEKGVENAIFRNIETFLPIATSRTPELSMTPNFKNPMTREFAMSTKKGLQAEWEVHQNMRPKLSRGIRNHQINLLGIFKLGRDPETGEYWTEEVMATDVVISKNGDFIAHYIKDRTLGDLLDMFPEKEKEILTSLGYGATVSKELRSSPVEYIEAWTDKQVGWLLNDVVLGFEDNPHYDYDGTDIQGQKVFFNHFKRPKMPWLFLKYFNLGRHVYDDTSLIEQGIGPQDWINKRKRQIGANADSTNGHWVSSGDFISQEEFDKIQGGVDEKIWLESGLPADGLMKITGQPLPDYIYQDLLDSRSALDNLMGTHSTTRGERSGNNTATQDIMAKDQDYGRIDGYVRDCVEIFAQEWYQYMYHMYMVYETEDRAIAIPEDNDFESDNIVFSQERIPLIQKKDGTVIPIPMTLMVKQGSTLPIDEVAEYQRAFQMKDILHPMDYFKKMGEPNPRELTKNLLIWMHDPFMTFKDDKDIQELMQAMAQKGKESPTVSVSVKGDTPQGTAMLEQMGHLPQGFTQFSIQQQREQMMMKTNPSPKPGQPRVSTKKEMTEEKQPVDMPQQQPTSSEVPQELQGKEGLVNAMTEMMRSGEAQQIMGGGPTVN